MLAQLHANTRYKNLLCFLRSSTPFNQTGAPTLLDIHEMLLESDPQHKSNHLLISPAESQFYFWLKAVQTACKKHKKFDKITII
jgi:hypothetical protein